MLHFPFKGSVRRLFIILRHKLRGDNQKLGYICIIISSFLLSEVFNLVLVWVSALYFLQFRAIHLILNVASFFFFDVEILEYLLPPESWRLTWCCLTWLSSRNLLLYRSKYYIFLKCYYFQNIINLRRNNKIIPVPCPLCVLDQDIKINILKININERDSRYQYLSTTVKSFLDRI